MAEKSVKVPPVRKWVCETKGDDSDLHRLTSLTEEGKIKLEDLVLFGEEVHCKHYDEERKIDAELTIKGGELELDGYMDFEIKVGGKT